MDNILSDEIKNKVMEFFGGLDNPVQIILFTTKDKCETCDIDRELLTEVAQLSGQLELVEYDLDEHADLASQFKVSRAPAVVIAGKDSGAMPVDYGIRLLGIPSGSEFTSLINDLVMVSTCDSGLSDETRTFLAGLTQPVHLQVFVTPTCPYCPRAVVLAHQMALESPLVEAEMVEAMEFPELANQYGVSGVPHTSINFGAGTLIGAWPEAQLVAEIARTIQSAPETQN